MKQLTKAEEDVMQVLWALEDAKVADIIEQLPEPKPAYNTVSTVVRILETKGFVNHRAEGKGYRYFPLLSKSEYSHQSLNRLADRYFQGSFKSMVSFFMKKNELSLEELESILNQVNEEK